MVQKTVEALRGLSAEIFMDMYDEDTFMTVVHKTMLENSEEDVTQPYDYLLNDPTFWRGMLELSFEDYLSELEKNAGGQIKTIELVSHKLQHEEIDGVMNHKTLSVTILVNGKETEFSMYASEYRGCHYLMEGLY